MTTHRPSELRAAVEASAIYPGSLPLAVNWDDAAYRLNDADEIPDDGYRGLYAASREANRAMEGDVRRLKAMAEEYAQLAKLRESERDEARSALAAMSALWDHAAPQTNIPTMNDLEAAMSNVRADIAGLVKIANRDASALSEIHRRMDSMAKEIDRQGNAIRRLEARALEPDPMRRTHVRAVPTMTFDFATAEGDG